MIEVVYFEIAFTEAFFSSGNNAPSMTKSLKKFRAVLAVAIFLTQFSGRASAFTQDIYELKAYEGFGCKSYAENEYLAFDMVGRERRLRKVRARFAKILGKADDVIGTKEQLVNCLIKPFPKTYHPPDQMVAQVKAGLNYFPRPILAMMVKQKYSVYLADKVSNLRDGLEKKHPGSYPEGETYDSVPAFASWRGKYIAIGYRYRNNGKIVPDFTIDESVRHEVGHVLDYSFGTPTFDEDFYAAFSADKAALTARESKFMTFYTYRRGRHEVFADMVEAFYRYPGSELGQWPARSFSRTYSVMVEILPAPEAASRALVAKRSAYDKEFRAKNYEKAISLAQEMVSLRLGLDPSGGGAANYYGLLVNSHNMSGDLKDAQVSCLKKIACLPPIEGCENPAVIEPLLRLATYKSYLGDYRESEKLCARAEAALKTVVEWHRSEQINLLLNKSSNAQLREDYSGAMAYAVSAMSIAAEYLGLRSGEMIRSQESAASVAIDQEQLDKADATLQVALKRAEAAKLAGRQCWIQDSLACIQRKRENFDEARRLLDAAGQNFETVFPKNHPYRVSLLLESARLYLAQKQYAEARADIERGVKLSEKSGVVYDIDRIKLWKVYAELLRDTGENNEADKMASKAAAMQKAYDEQ